MSLNKFILTSYRRRISWLILFSPSPLYRLHEYSNSTPIYTIYCTCVYKHLIVFRNQHEIGSTNLRSGSILIQPLTECIIRIINKGKRVQTIKLIRILCQFTTNTEFTCATTVSQKGVRIQQTLLNIYLHFEYLSSTHVKIMVYLQIYTLVIQKSDTHLFLIVRRNNVYIGIFENWNC